jgi:hypothetical protein
MKDVRLPVLKAITLMLIGLALFLFFTSLFEPVFITTGKPILGYWVFAIGWMGFIILQFAWYANLLSLLSLLLMFKHPLRAFLLSLFSLFFAAESFLFDEIPQNIRIIDIDIGFYLWMGAHCAVLYASILMLIRQKMIEHDLGTKKPSN